MADAKSEFKNDSPGVCGVVVLREGKPHGTHVLPGDTVWLSEAEQIETANAPKRSDDNPFTNGTLTLVTKATEVANRRPIGDTQAAQVPQSDDQRAADEKRVEETRKAAEAQKAEEERLAKARAQAEQPGQPLEEPGSISPSGQPRPPAKAPAKA